jgi:hypothetical protein
MFWKRFWPTVAIVMVLIFGAPLSHARPQVTTESIGWGDDTDIYCKQTSDHIWNNSKLGA